jgi:hypothetical protein
MFLCAQRVERQDEERHFVGSQGQSRCLFADTVKITEEPLQSVYWFIAKDPLN